MRIADREIGHGHPPYVIAEAGLNHCGSVDKALEMVDVAKRAGCDAVKFQTFRAAGFCRTDDPMYATFERCELPDHAWATIKAECDRQDITFLSTPQNRSDLDILLKVGIPAIKVGSDDFCNHALLKDYAREGLPMILSCGMADAWNVYQTLEVLGRWPILLLCTSQYPAPVEELNLARISFLRRRYPELVVGFSDHSVGCMASMLAQGAGACVFERHFMLLDTDAPDAAFALQPDALAKWVKRIRLAHTMLGTDEFRLTERERESRQKFQRVDGQQIRGHEAG